MTYLGGEGGDLEKHYVIQGAPFKLSLPPDIGVILNSESSMESIAFTAQNGFNSKGEEQLRVHIEVPYKI